MIEIILLFIFAFLFINYILFLLEILSGLKNVSTGKEEKIPEEFVSVIIPFRNESENILKSLKSLSEQDYPIEKYEVIYVNDSSTDDSLYKIMAAEKPSNFNVISLSDFSSEKAFKKKAVSFGIENARGSIIVTTDADCMHNRSWLSELLSNFDNQTGFISGPVGFEPGENVFSKIQALEFAGLVLSGAGLIGKGKPTICNGANLAFRKSVFKKLKGYSDQMHLSSGEDELLMQKISVETDYNVKFCWRKEAVVFTQPNKSINDFFQQRKRWASKGLFYKNNVLIFRLILIYLFYLGIIAQIFLSIFLSKLILVNFIVCLIFKFFLEYKIISAGRDFLFNRGLMKYFFVSEIFQIIYLIIAGVSGTFGSFKWKERIIKR